MDIFKKVKENEALLIEMRRHLHENPELSTKEFNTVEYIKEKLDDFGVSWFEVKHGGIIATIGDASKGKTVLLRADCDALPMQENPNNLKGPKDCVSKIDGVCHACGHDGHTAMMLITAKILKEMEDELDGLVYCVFERAEETGGNMRYLLRYFDEHDITFDAIYGTHLLSTYETGKISVEPNGVMAGAFGFNVKITGRGGHGSRPDLSISPIDCFNAFYTGLNALRIKYITPFDSLTFSVGQLASGKQGNVIPDDLTFSGTARFFNQDLGFKFREEFEHLLKLTCEAYHCTYEATLSQPGLAVLNNPDMSAFAKKAIATHLGEEYVGKVDPWMASEPFSIYLQLWPGAFAFLGMKNDEKGVGAEHHNEYFDVDEDVLVLGAAASAAYAYEFLKNPITPVFTPYNGRPMDLLAKQGYTDFED